MNLEILRRLAKSNKYQLLYRRAKELSLKLFNNDTDLTKLQIFFLYWLSIYDSLYADLSRKEKLISEDVINDSMRVDAYLLWREEENKKQSKNPKGKKTNNIINSSIPSVIFKSKK